MAVKLKTPASDRTQQVFKLLCSHPKLFDINFKYETTISTNDGNSTHVASETLLHLCAMYNRPELVKILVSVDHLNIDEVTAGGYSALWISASRGFIVVVRLLLIAGSNVNFQDENLGISVLHSASKKGHISVVKLLLARPVDVNLATFDFGMTALMSAVIHSHADVVHQLLSHPLIDPNLTYKEVSLLIVALSGGNEYIGILQQLLAHPAVNVNEMTGLSALWCACYQSQSKIVQVLLAHGAVETVSDSSTPNYICTSYQAALAPGVANIDIHTILHMMDAGLVSSQISEWCFGMREEIDMINTTINTEVRGEIALFSYALTLPPQKLALLSFHCCRLKAAGVVELRSSLSIFANCWPLEVAFKIEQCLLPTRQTCVLLERFVTHFQATVDS